MAPLSLTREAVLYIRRVRFLTILMVGGVLLASCGGGSDGKATPTPAPQQPFPPPTGENADVVQFLRDYYLTYEDVFSGRVPPAKLIAMYAQHCTENLRPGALDLLVVSMSTNRPAANATKVTQVDVVDIDVKPRAEPDPDFEFLTVSFPN